MKTNRNKKITRLQRFYEIYKVYNFPTLRNIENCKRNKLFYNKIRKYGYLIIKK